MIDRRSPLARLSRQNDMDERSSWRDRGLMGIVARRLFGGERGESK